MSVRYLREAAATGDREKLVRFVRLHLGDGNEEAGRKEIDKSWAEALTVLLDYWPTDKGFIREVVKHDPSTLALLYFHLHFYFIKRTGEWIHDGSR
jgi:hypothetical protein